MFQRWGREAPVVPSDRFLTQAAAAERLGTGAGMRLGYLIACGALEPAFLADGTEGVTLESVETEMAWRESATVGMKMRRRLKHAIRSI